MSESSTHTLTFRVSQKWKDAFDELIIIGAYETNVDLFRDMFRQFYQQKVGRPLGTGQSLEGS